MEISLMSLSSADYSKLPELVDMLMEEFKDKQVSVSLPSLRIDSFSIDIAKTVQLQKQILENMWQQLKVGGTLLYITCSILKAENEQQMVDFFAEHTDAKEIKIDADWGVEQIHGRQLLPQVGRGDGFYYCRIEKI